jgi:hypothetical protein
MSVLSQQESARIPEASRRPLALGTLAAGVLAVASFFGLGFALQGWWFVVALVFGVAAIALGVPARRASPKGAPGRRMATVGLVSGGAIVAWFAIFMVVSALN